MADLNLFAILLIIFGILQIILFFKLWIMTNDVAALRKKLAPAIDTPKKQQNLLGMYVRCNGELKEVTSVEELEKIVNEIKGEETEPKPIGHKNIRGKEYFEK